MSVVSNSTKKPSVEVTYPIILLVMWYYLITTLQVRRRIQFRVLNRSVTVYEGGDRYLRQFRQTTAINDVDDIVDVQHVAVGGPDTVWGEQGGVLDPENLDRCDVLELDCEGAELGILSNISIRPRVIIVENHPSMGGYNSPTQVIDLLSNMGYSIESFYTNNRRERLSKEEFVNAVTQSKLPIAVATSPRSNDR